MVSRDVKITSATQTHYTQLRPPPLGFEREGCETLKHFLLRTLLSIVPKFGTIDNKTRAISWKSNTGV